jgi:SAM-dependent methyltransferase
VSDRGFSYSPGALRLYDFIAYRVDAPLLWRCSVRDLLALYDREVSGRHLDVGVGTGYLLDRCRFPVAVPQVTLMDLNPGPLAYAARRLRRYSPVCHRADMLEPWPLPRRSFDSIALSNVLVCAAGEMPQKAVAFEHARECLAPGGRLFGCTVLNGGVPHTRRSRLALRALNKRGVFSNRGDHRADLEAALAATFDSYEIAVKGSVAFFAAEMRG